jgi:DNA polymerase-3 subunit delta
VIVVLRGADQMAIRRRLQALKDEADAGSGMLANNLTTLDGREVRSEEILAAVMTPPFLAPRRLVLVEGLLERFESRDGAPPPGRASRRLEGLEPLFSALEGGYPGTTTLAFVSGEVRERNPVLERLKAIPGVEDANFPELKGEGLIRFIRDEAAVRGIRFRNGPWRRQPPLDDELAKLGDPAALLAAISQVEVRPNSNEWRSDTLGLANELDKLALYSMGRDVTVDDVYELCPGARHASHFALADAVMDGNLKRALEVFHSLVRDGAETQALLGMVAGRYRTLGIVTEMLEAGAADAEFEKAVGNSWRYPGLREAQKRRARRHGMSGVRAAIEAIVDCDRSIKLGETEDEVGFEVLVMRLARLAGR